MGEYISKKQTIDRIASCYCMDCEHSNGILCRACEHQDDMDLIDDMPTADVQPVKKGHWYHNTSKYISELDAYFIQACCSCCGRYSDRIDNYSQIMSNETCSHCGARMDG